MCGIAGWIGAPVNDPVIIENIIKSLYHRGPDDQKTKVWPEATLIHTRLSIVDLSDTGSQPMSNEDGTIWTIFNGEIYNHHEIQESLLRKGHIFRGRSDTEVIPHLYEEYGIAFLDQLRGMFALSVWDSKKKCMLLARDRFGIKPLFYAATQTRLAFASELRTLLCLPDVDRHPNRQAISDYAALLYIPAPLTFYSGIRALQPCEALLAQWENNVITWKFWMYHQWKVEPDLGLDFDQAAEKSDELIMKAVASQMESDVPLGTLLSGGIDSSLVTALAQKNHISSIQSFSVSFDDAHYDETWAALAVAKHIGSKHTIMAMQASPNSFDHVVEVLLQCGQPFADTSLFAASALCQLIREHVIVALSGDGGDEIFGGYESFRRIAEISILQTLPPTFSRMAKLSISGLAGLGILPSRYVPRFDFFSTADDVGILSNLQSWLRTNEHASLLQSDRDLLPVQRWFTSEWKNDLPVGATRLERLSAHATEIMLRLGLANDYLFKVDTASMRSSLEVRVPMLDEDLVQFGLRLPHSFKIKGRKGKRILRSVAEHWLPSKIAHKPKRGFGVPIDTWLGKEFREALVETVQSTSGQLNEIFNPDVYQPWINAFYYRKPLSSISRAGLYQHVIMLFSLALHL